MTPNIAASVKVRLLNRSRELQEDFQILLTRYGLERFLYRLGRTDFAGDFILKDAMLFSVWAEEPHRSTRDIDFLGFGEASADRLIDVFRQVCAVPFPDDGLVFRPDSVRADTIRDLQEYGGFRVALQGRLGAARIPVQLDVGFGDAVTPAPQEIEYPTILPLPAPRILAYPPESVIAEKVQALIALGMANSRMKDLYDLLVLSRQFSFRGTMLREALRATFERRRTPIPEAIPVALTEEFSTDAAKVRQWKAFLSRLDLPAGAEGLPDVVAQLREFLWPVLGRAPIGVPTEAVWPAGGPWRDL